MAQINIVTGYTGEAHVKSEEDALLNRFLLGQNKAILSANENHTSNSITVSCDAIVDGRLIRTDSSQTFSIVPPGSGYFRNDIIVICYCKNNATGIESAYLDYIEGSPSSSYPAPIPTVDDHDGTLVSSIILYNLLLRDTNIPEVEWTGDADLPLEIEDDYEVYRVYNAGTADSSLMGRITTYKVPISGGVSLVVGRGTDYGDAMQGGKTYGYEIRYNNGADFPETLLGGGVQISVSDWNSQQTYTSVAQDKIRVGIKPSVNVASGSAQINFWYVGLEDFS